MSAPKNLSVTVGVDFQSAADQLHAAADALHPASAHNPAARRGDTISQEQEVADIGEWAVAGISGLIAAHSPVVTPPELNDLVAVAKAAGGDAALWTDAWLAHVVANRHLLERSDNDMWGWMVGWFANAIMSDRDHRREKRVGYGVVMFPGNGATPWMQGASVYAGQPAGASMSYLFQRAADAAAVATVIQEAVTDGALAVPCSLVPFHSGLAELLAAGAGVDESTDELLITAAAGRSPLDVSEDWVNTEVPPAGT